MEDLQVDYYALLEVPSDACVLFHAILVHKSVKDELMLRRFHPCLHTSWLLQLVEANSDGLQAEESKNPS